MTTRKVLSGNATMAAPSTQFLVKGVALILL